MTEAKKAVAAAAQDEQLAKLPVPIHVALAAACADVGTIGKDRQNKEQGYAFRSIEAIKAEVRGALAKHGIVLLPQVIEHERWTTPRGPKGNPWDHVVLRMRYTFVGPAGDRLVTETIGEGLDNGDKAYTKAATFALKTLLTQLFVISDKDEADPDAGAPPEATPPAPPAPPAWETLGWNSEPEFMAARDVATVAVKDLTDEQRAALRESFHWPLSPTDHEAALDIIAAMREEPGEAF